MLAPPSSLGDVFNVVNATKHLRKKSDTQENIQCKEIVHSSKSPGNGTRMITITGIPNAHVMVCITIGWMNCAFSILDLNLLPILAKISAVSLL